MSILSSQVHWPSLARDLAVLSVPDTPLDLPAILRTYSLSKEELATILTNPSFMKMYEKEVAFCESQGSKVAVRYRASTLSQALSEKLFRDAINDAMDSKDALKLLDLLMHASGVMEEDKSPVALQNNVQINLPLPHVNKLAHCFVEQNTEALDV